MTRHVCPPDHKHDLTSTCATLHKCTCDDCRRGQREYKYWARQMQAHGRLDVFDTDVDATGVRRRLQALMAIGWSLPAIAAHIGQTGSAMHNLINRRDRVTKSTHARIAKLYDALADTRPPRSTKAQRVSVTRTLAHAVVHGYARPIDWDDIDSDPAPSIDPQPVAGYIDVIAIDLATSATPESPAGLTLTREERHIAVRELNGRGFNDQEISRMLLVADKTIGRDREHLGIPPVEDSWLDRGARKAMAA